MILASLATTPALFAGAVFILGLLVGSFLNVVIYRMPVMLDRQWRRQAEELEGGTPAAPAERFDLVRPRSTCRACKTPIRAIHNIPVLSWLLLRGRCASCGAPIGARYPLVELLTACLSAAVAWKFGYGWPALAGLVLTWFLVALAFIDLDHQLLPDDLTLPLLWLGLLVSLSGSVPVISTVPVDALECHRRRPRGYLSLWSVYHVFRLLTGKEGMGYGDFKLLAALGAWLGWQMLLPIVLGAAAVGAVTGIAMIILQGRDRSTPIPFGPFLAAAGWIVLLFGREIVDRYLGLSGLH
ncbi:MAG: prepilin peptidase [Gammaproteobacteria bacterium]|nr:prepilin peptidase [Gammaproteobacteria bacterium]